MASEGRRKIEMAKKSGKTDKRTFLIRLICIILAVTMVGTTVLAVVMWLFGH